MARTRNTSRLAAFLDKGGTGKTTSVAHLGVALEELGHRVLLLDLAGKQGDLGKHFGVWSEYREEAEAGNAWPNISTVFTDEWPAIAEKLGEAEAVEGLILETGEGPDLVPAHPGLDTLDADLGNIDEVSDRYSRLERFLDDYVDPLDRYDVVLIDLPGLTNNVAYNGLWATKHVMAPVEMGPFEAEQADALRKDLERIAEGFDVDVSLELVVPNKVDLRTNLAAEYLEAFADEYPEAIAPSIVPYSQDIRNSAEEGRTAFALEEPSKTARRARGAYLDAASDVLERLEGGVEA